MAGTISIRLGLEGALQLKQQLEDTGNTGSAAFAKLRSGLERLGAQDTNSVVQAIQRVTQTMQQATAAVGQAQAASFAGIGPQADYKARAADIAAYGASMDALRAKYNPLFAASKQYEATLDEIAAAEKLGALSTAEATAARDRITSAFARAQAPIASNVAALKEHTATTNNASFATRNLGIQTIQAVSGIATGQPVLTTLIQQGHQVFDSMLAAGQGFASLGSAAKGMLSAVGGLPTLLTVGLVGGLVAVGSAAEHEAARLADLRQSLRLTHDDYAGLADAVEASAKRVVASSNLSRGTVEEIGKAIASSPYLGSFAGDLDDLTKSAANFARVAGVDAAAAGKLFRQALDEPAAAAAAMASQHLPAMNTALLRTITALDASGDHAKASALTLDALKTSTKGATEDVSPLSAAMTALGNAFTTTGANGKSFASEIGTFVSNDLAIFLTQIKDLVEKAQALRDWVGSKGVTPATPITGGGASYSQQLLQGAPETFTRIQDIGQANKIPEAIIGLATRVAYRESRGQQYDTLRDPSGQTLLSSDGKHFGIGQLDAGTAKDMGVDYTTVDGNILGMLKRLYQISQDPRLNLNEGTISGAYNMGPQGMADVLAGKRTLPDETDRYSQAVAGIRVKSGSGAADAATTLPAVGVSAVRYPESVERALAPFSKLGSEGTPEATQTAAKADIDKYTAAINDLKAAGETTSPTMDRLQQLLAKARGEFANAIGPINSVTRGITDQLGPLQAESGAARAVADAINQQVLAARGSGRTVTDTQAEAARAAVLRNLAAAFNEVVTGTERSTAANERIAGTLDQGAASFIQATNREKALAQAREDFLPGPEQDAAVDQYTAALNRQSASVADLTSVQNAFNQRDQLEVLQLETATLGQNTDLRDKELALLQARQALLRQGADLDSAASRASLANVAAIADGTAALKAQQAAYNELTGFIDNTFGVISTSIVSAFATGKLEALKFKDLMKSVASAVISEFAKLAVLNPLKNLLFGTSGASSPTLSSVGGVLGLLLNNSASGSGTAAAAAADANAVFGGAGGVVGAAGGAATIGSSLFNSPLGSIASLGKSVFSLFSGSAAAGAAADANAVFGGAGGIAGAASGTGGAVGGFAGAAGSVAGAFGASDATVTAITSAAGTVADALPYIGTAIGVVTSLISGNYKAAAITAGTAVIGAYIGSIVATPGIGTAIGAAVGSLIGTFLPNHPLHPFEDVELNVAGGKLVTGKSDGQLADVKGLVSATQTYADGVNRYLDSVGVRILTADGNIGRIGQGITGLAQTLDPGTTFDRLLFDNKPDDTSQFGVAKGALNGMTFANPQALADELAKIAGFADATQALGIKLAYVGKDISNIQISGVSGGNAAGTSTVKTADGQSVSFLSDLKTALNVDLPKQSYADVGALDTEIQRVSDFLSSTIPQLLTPIKTTQSTLMDQYNAIRERYAGAAQQSKNLGLDNTDVLRAASDKALAILMEPATRALNTAALAVTGRFATQAYGISGSGKASNDNLAQTQLNERASLEDSWRQTWGDGVISSQAYQDAMKALIATQDLEAQATREQMQLAQEQAFASLTATEADIAKRAGVNSLSQQLSAYDAKAAAETDSFIKSWRDYYGQYAAVGSDFQDQMIALYKAHSNERLQIEQDYTSASTAALKTAQGSATTLLGNLKDYAIKLQTGSLSTLSPTAQYDLAKSQFNAVAGAAAAGDATSASQLTGYADTFLTASQAYNGSGTGYAADFSKVLDALQGVTSNADALTNSFLAQQVQQQTDTLATAITTTSEALKQEVAALRREMQGVVRAMVA